MRVASYNVLGLTGFPAEHGLAATGGASAEGNITYFSNVFNGFGADIIALQEGVASAAIKPIAKQMGYYLSTATSPTAFPGHVLSKYPIIESRTFSHVDAQTDVPLFSRTCGATLLEWNDALLWVVNVHLHPKDIDMRNKEAAYFSDILGTLLSLTEHMLVLGDFNCAVDEQIHQDLKSIDFTNTIESTTGLAPTMDNHDRNTLTIDHIYCSPSLKDSLQTAAVYRLPGFYYDKPLADGEWVHSDHMPVTADFSD